MHTVSQANLAKIPGVVVLGLQGGSSIWASPLSKALSTPQRGRMSCAGVDVGAAEGAAVGFAVVGAPVGPAAALALGLAFALAPTDTHHNRITSHHIPYIHTSQRGRVCQAAHKYHIFFFESPIMFQVRSIKKLFLNSPYTSCISFSSNQ